MEQGYSVAIVGAGASGCMCAYFLLKAGFEVTVFDYGEPLRTLLPTGGGRCNLAHAEYDFKELAKNYPRGEKFLYSVFSRFSTEDTLNTFEEIGVKTYSQDDGRIFPTSDSSKEVKKSILNSIKKAEIIKEKVTEISPLENGYKLKTDKADYLFDKIVISIGGGKKIEGLNHKIVPFKPSLVGLNTDVTSLSGVVLKNVFCKDCSVSGDILFTHFGLSGPLIYKLSSIKAYDEFPYTLHIDFYPYELDLQSMLNNSPHKELKNILSEIFPHKFSEFLAGNYANRKGHMIDGKIRDELIEKIHNFEFQITGTNKGDETVTAGGYDLDEINPKTMESKIHPQIYFTGETLNIDGFCGGFNLQNAWSTAYIAADGIINKG